MNLVVGQSLTVGALNTKPTLSDIFSSAGQSRELVVHEGLRAANRFAELLKDVETRDCQLDFSCSDHFEARLTHQADLLVSRLNAALDGIVTRVDVDNLCMLKFCVNALVAEKAEFSAFGYACFAKNWCCRADFTDGVATGTAITATAEMFCRLRRYEEAARLFKSSASILESVLDYEHPLTAYSRKRHRMTLTKLALNGRSKAPVAYGAGYLKATESPSLCALVWEGPVPC